MAGRRLLPWGTGTARVLLVMSTFYPRRIGRDTFGLSRGVGFNPALARKLKPADPDLRQLSASII